MTYGSDNPTLVDKLDAVVRELNVPSVLANAFADMYEEEQAQFFIEVARLMQAWSVTDGLYMQSLRIGKNLRMNAAVREMLMTILVSAEEDEK